MDGHGRCSEDIEVLRLRRKAYDEKFHEETVALNRKWTSERQKQDVKDLQSALQAHRIRSEGLNQSKLMKEFSPEQIKR